MWCICLKMESGKSTDRSRILWQKRGDKMFKKGDTVVVLPTCHERSMIGKILTVTSGEIKLTYSDGIVVFTEPKGRKGRERAFLIKDLALHS